MERLEVREGKDLENDKKTNERRRLEEMNKGVLYLIVDKDYANGYR